MVRPSRIPATAARIERLDSGNSAVGQPVQFSFDEVGTSLFDATFVVVDLETTGARADTDAITEIGATKVQGGETIGEFQTLVNPESAIPASITVLTGISNSMVVAAPTIAAVLPAFLEFLGDGILVAHNARFDVTFLRRAAERLQYPWPKPRVVDTLALARKVVLKDEAPNHKLGTLAKLFHAETDPNHRALSDARATVDVLHGLLARLAPLGVTHVEDLATAADPVPPARRRKAVMAEGIRQVPGVYTFYDASGSVLYIGKSMNLRKRVRSYFTAAEKRKRIAHMLDLADSVRVKECVSDLQASVEELREIAARQPRFNSRSRRPLKHTWIQLTDEPFPRFKVATTPPRSNDTCVGPFASSSAAKSGIEALVVATGLRSCTQRLPATPDPKARSCLLLTAGKCSAPCTHADTDYAQRVAKARAILRGDTGIFFERVMSSMAQLALAERFEEAATRRDAIVNYLRAARRGEEIASLLAHAELVAGRRHPNGGWEVVVIRYGRFAGTTVTPAHEDPMPHIEAAIEHAESVNPPDSVAAPASDEEVALLIRWLSAEGVRLIKSSLTSAGAGWALPVNGASAYWSAFHGRAGVPQTA